jgi:hypothetical protein
VYQNQRKKSKRPSKRKREKKVSSTWKRKIVDLKKDSKWWSLWSLPTQKQKCLCRLMKEVSKKRIKEEMKYLFQKLDSTRRTYDMVTVSKDQTISSIYIGAGGS